MYLYINMCVCSVCMVYVISQCAYIVYVHVGIWGRGGVRVWGHKGGFMVVSVCVYTGWWGGRGVGSVWTESGYEGGELSSTSGEEMRRPGQTESRPGRDTVPYK